MRNSNMSLIVKCLIGWIALTIALTVISIIWGSSIITFGINILYTYFIAIPGIFVAGYYLFTNRRGELFDQIRQTIKNSKIFNNNLLFILIGIVFGFSLIFWLITVLVKE